MDTWGIAEAYANEGFLVRVLDAAGAAAANRDLLDVLFCDVMRLGRAGFATFFKRTTPTPPLGRSTRHPAGGAATPPLTTAPRRN